MQDHHVLVRRTQLLVYLNFLHGLHSLDDFFALVESGKVFEEGVDLFVVEGCGVVGGTDEVAEDGVEFELLDPVGPIVYFQTRVTSEG